MIRCGDIEDELRKLATSNEEFEKLRHELDDNINPVNAVNMACIIFPSCSYGIYVVI